MDTSFIHLLDDLDQEIVFVDRNTDNLFERILNACGHGGLRLPLGNVYKVN